MQNLDLSPYEQAKLKDILLREFKPVIHKNFDLPDYREYRMTVPIPKTEVNNKLFIKIYNKKTAKVKLKEVLTREQEAILFPVFNFCKFKINEIKQKNLTVKSVKELFQWYDRLKEVQEQIVHFNLRLVFLMIRKFSKCPLDLDDLVSDGNESILKAADQFDQEQGNKFSTYLYLSISRNFIKLIKKHNNSNKKVSLISLDEGLMTKGDVEIKDNDKDDTYNLKVLRYVLKYNKAKLNKLELDIINKRYPLDKSTDFKPATLESIGDKWGKNKNTIATMEKVAMDKIYERMQDHLK